MWTCILLLALLWAVPVSAATLTWTGTATNELGVLIERADATCATAAVWAQIGEVGVNVTTYLDATTQTGYRYCYRVRAFNDQFVGGPRQHSLYSNTAGIDYPFPVPASPGLGDVLP